MRKKLNFEFVVDLLVAGYFVMDILLQMLRWFAYAGKMWYKVDAYNLFYEGRP